MRFFEFPPIELPVDFYLQKAEIFSLACNRDKFLSDLVANQIATEIVRREIAGVTGEEIIDTFVMNPNSNAYMNNVFGLDLENGKTLYLYDSSISTTIEDFQLRGSKVADAVAAKDNVIFIFERDDVCISATSDGFLVA
ncbi:hypothetical protein KKG52_02395 [Patescibacteria group bacterium]|nr:hypothetical protein [Patescibacteria group bacterium]